MRSASPARSKNGAANSAMQGSMSRGISCKGTAVRPELSVCAAGRYAKQHHCSASKQAQPCKAQCQGGLAAHVTEDGQQQGHMACKLHPASGRKVWQHNLQHCNKCMKSVQCLVVSCAYVAAVCAAIRPSTNSSMRSTAQTPSVGNHRF